MSQTAPGEQWKAVDFDFEYTNDYVIEVSNYGRLRTFNKFSDGNILKGSMINGYRIIRLKFYRPRDAESEHKFNFLKDQTMQLAKKLRELKKAGGDEKQIADMEKLHESMRKNLSKKFQNDMKERTIHYHSLIHRLVADYFVPRPSEEHSVVAHLDYNKLNNRAANLQWMTPEENFRHQQKSPFVIAHKENGMHLRRSDSKVNKLTVTKVMLLKKLLNEGKPIRTLVKQFKVTDTQILRIKRGENWGDIQPAK